MLGIFTSNLPTIEEMKNILMPGRSDSVTPCCGSSVGGAHAIACHCRQEAADTLYSMKEVSYHCDTQSCWVVVENAVYDLTDFIYDHPGGMDIILEHAGADATGVFQDVGHSPWAATLLAKFKIGMLNVDERITS